jgi:uncharacterized membrane protein
MLDEIWERYKGTCLGTVGGIFFGIVYLIFGFWDMLVFAAVVLIGYTAGKKADRNEPWVDFDKWRKLFSEKWRLFR